MKAEIGIIGLGVMGKSLALHAASKGYSVVVYSHKKQELDEFTEAQKQRHLLLAFSLPDFLEALALPRKILLMIPAGSPVDEVIRGILDQLSEGDLIIDGGNSFFKDSMRRIESLQSKKILFLGMGVSGGESGARYGACFMPGGSPKAYEMIKPILDSLSAQAEGVPCSAYMGPNGAGHYVKMVHNCIEYANMQLISEAYLLMKSALGFDSQKIGQTFQSWNQGDLRSYLMEITANIFFHIDQVTGLPLVELILDKTGQKGTGRWGTQSALDLGAPIPTIAAATFERSISLLKEDRIEASKVFDGPPLIQTAPAEWIDNIQKALSAAIICSHAQGFALLKAASDEYHWNLDYSAIASIWRGGCIINSKLLDKIKIAWSRTPTLSHLMKAPYFQKSLQETHLAWRKVAALGIQAGIPLPGFLSALSYFDSYRSARLGTNLIQAQRDYFGAHTYERIDQEGIFHTQW